MLELSVVVPVLNEEASIIRFLEQLEETLREVVSSFEVIIVDDGSRDKTWPLLAEAVKTRSHLRLFRLSRNFGKDAAVSAGIAEATGQACLIMDGDFEHPLELIPQMWECFTSTNVNVVDAVKTRAPSEGWLSRLSAYTFYRLFKILAGYDLGGHTDYKLFDQKVRLAWLDLREKNIFFRGMLEWLGFQHAQVAFTVPLVAGRRSRWSRSRLFGLALKSITSFSSLPLQLVTLASVVGMAVAALLSVQTIYRWAAGQSVEGFTTVILLQLFQGSVTTGALGILGTYIARISEEVKARPRYFVLEHLSSADS